MKDTVFPEVTTILLVCGDNSIDVIGFGKLRLVEKVRVRRSHHLSYVERWEHEPEADDKRGSHLIFPSSPAVTPVWSPTQTTLLTVPSCDRAPVPSKRKSGSVSGRLRSNIRTFFSCPPVSM